MIAELTDDGLPSGRTVEEAGARATARKNHLWGSADWADVSEDEKLEALEVFCTSLYRGDTVQGKLLASIVLWGG